ncbi:DUF2514 family protein [Pigmentiphaga daeguensis]|uniref:DUF2514 domain-containing protein n=1 Tax=Pigmentiphaga daeguensis TaxID=414049 RepID=A0ABN1BU52_9BURK
MIPAWLRYGAVAALAGIAVGVAQGWRYGERIAALERDWSKERAALSDAARRAEAANRQTETRMQEAVENERTESRAREAQYADAAAGARAERDRLRQQLATGRGGGASQDPGAGSDVDGTPDNAAVLRFVVGQCVDRYIDVAAEADRLGARLMGLQGYVRAIQPASGP